MERLNKYNKKALYEDLKLKEIELKKAIIGNSPENEEAEERKEKDETGGQCTGSPESFSRGVEVE